MLTGSPSNVHPSHFGETVADETLPLDPERDALTLALVRACVDQGVPLLGICRGFQEVNVAMGGTLYPEIRDLPGRMNHRMPPDGTIEEKFALRHPVRFAEGGVFHRLMGAAEVMTNTLHGQGIKQPGQRIVIDGYAPFCKLHVHRNWTTTRCLTIAITDDNRHLLRSGYEARNKDELPVLTRWFEGLMAPVAESIAVAGAMAIIAGALEKVDRRGFDRSRSGRGRWRSLHHRLLLFTGGKQSCSSY